MSSRQKTGSEGARLPRISRRAVIAGSTVATIGVSKVAVAHASSDQTAKLYGSWLRIDAKIDRQQTRWAKLESWLSKEHRWFHLTDKEQYATPWAQELDDIDGIIVHLYRQREALTERLPTEGAANLEAVVIKLLVVEKLVSRYDHPEAHDMIVGAVKDLTALSASRSGLHALASIRR